jgi:hypothetical protein
MLCGVSRNVDPQARTIKEGHGVSSHVGIMGSLEEKNARVFQNNASTRIMVISKIKEETML